MIERRIRFEKDKTDIIKRLVTSDESSGPFRLIADVLVFAAAIGLKRKRRTPLGDALAEPIRQEVFDRQGYDTMINLVAIHVDKSAGVLADSDEMVERRAAIFEEYANGGLEILQGELLGAVNALETTSLIINAERTKRDIDNGGFDLSKFVT